MRLHLARMNRVVGTLRWAVHDPAKVFWLMTALLLSGVLGGVGGTYLFQGQGAGNNPALHLVSSVPGGVRIHGGLLMLLAVLNIWALAAVWQAYNRRAWMLHRWASMLTLFYALMCSLVQGYFDIDPTTLWYAFAAALSLILLVLSPPFGAQEDLHNRGVTTDSSNCA